MTTKDYFRQMALHDLGYPADPKLIELRDYLEYQLTNLNKYDIKDYPNWIGYGKSEDNIILEYSEILMHVNFLTKENNSNISYVLLNLSDILSYVDPQKIIMSYIENILRIKVSVLVII